MKNSHFYKNPDQFIDVKNLGQVCRLGLATRGNTQLDCDAVETAIERGINYLNWCGHADGMQQAIRKLGRRRHEVFVAIQFHARTAAEARRELKQVLDELNTDYIDVVTHFYVEHPQEWQQILSPGGAMEVLEAARTQGTVRSIGMTSHQRPLAAMAAESGRLDLLMIRYNAAHRGAETDVFPVTQQENIPVVAFTCLRWGALLKSTPADPHGFQPAQAFQWYRFVLCQPAVAVALMAPNGNAELQENLALLDDWQGLSDEDYAALRDHGKRVHQHARGFP